MPDRKYNVLTERERERLREARDVAKLIKVRAHERRVFAPHPSQVRRNRLVQSFISPFMKAIEDSGGPTRRDIRHAQEIVTWFDDAGLLPDLEIRVRSTPGARRKR